LIEDNRERAEEDGDTCGKIFRAIRARASRSSLKFSCRLGKRGRDPRPIVVGLYSEEERSVLGKARDLQNTLYKDVNIVPNLTQRNMQKRQNYKKKPTGGTKTDHRRQRKKTLKWLVVRKKGEKRLIKGQERERERERPSPITRRMENGGRGVEKEKRDEISKTTENRSERDWSEKEGERSIEHQTHSNKGRDNWQERAARDKPRG
jgi:hypothetical protein